MRFVDLSDDDGISDILNDDEENMRLNMHRNNNTQKK